MYNCTYRAGPLSARQRNAIRMAFRWPPGGGGGEGTLIFSHIRRLGLFFWVQNSEFQYFLGFQKNEYFLGYEDFVDIFLEVIKKLG